MRYPRHRPLIDNATAIAVDDDHVFISKVGEGGGLYGIPHDDASRMRVVSAHVFDRLDVDRVAIYAFKDSRVFRVSRSDGAERELATFPASPWATASDEEHLYASFLGDYPKHADGGVVRVSKDSGELAWLVRGAPCGAIGARDGTLYYSVPKPGHRVLGTMGDQIVARDGRGETNVLAAAYTPHAITFFDDLVVWTEFAGSGALAAVDRRGGDRIELAASPFCHHVAAVGRWLYWSQSTERKTAPAIFRVKPGQAPQPLAKFRSQMPELVGNTRIICWNDAGSVSSFDPRQLPD